MAAPDDQVDEKRQKWGKRIILLVIGLVFAAAVVCNYWPVHSKITISRETTYVLGPVNPDGTVNYVAALDERLSEGVTPENNAAPLLIRALGPDFLADSVRDKQLELLGIDPLPEEGDYFVSLDDYLARAASPSAAALKDMAWEKRQYLLDTLYKTPWSSTDHPAIAAWLKANEKPLALAVQATERPRYYVPAICPSEPQSMLALPIQHILPVMNLDRALALRAMLKLHDGEVRGATTDVLAMHRLARLIGRGPHLIDGLVAIAGEGTACEATVALAASGKLSAAEARTLMGELGALGPASDLVGALDRAERFMPLDCVMILSRSRNPVRAMTGHGGKGSSTRGPVTDAVSWDSVLRTFNRLYDAMVTVQIATNAVEIAKAEAEVKAIVGRAVNPHPVENFLSHFGGRAATALRTRVLTNTLLRTVMPAVERAFDMERAVRMKLKLARLSVALAALKAEKGAFPEKLSQLSPAYIRAVPQDSFTNKPLIYKRVGKGYVLYSVGPNMTDDGGQEDENAGKDDIVVQVK